ncbi:MAG: GNAT family N-acetyltransferase [Halioglobus sp.]
MKIEPSNKNDFPEMLAIFNFSRELNGSFPKHTYSIDEFLAVVEGEEILVARIGDEVVGFVSIWKPDNFLHHLFVSPKYQRKGVGKALISESVSRFGLPMFLKCIKENIEACRFYEQFGWQLKEEAIGPEGPYIHYQLGEYA